MSEFLSNLKKKEDEFLHKLVKDREAKLHELDEREKNLAGYEAKIKKDTLDWEHELRSKTTTWVDDTRNKNEKDWSEREIQLRNLESQKRVELQKWLEIEQSKREIDWKEREQKLAGLEANREKDIEQWKKDKQAEFLTKNKGLVEENGLLEGRIGELKSLFTKLDTDHATLKTENEKVKTESSHAVTQMTEMKREVDLMTQNRDRLLSDAKLYEKRVGEMKFEIDNHASRLENLKKEFESQKAQIKSQLEIEKTQMTKDTYDQVNQLKMLELEKLKQTKEDLLSELHKTKARLSKEIHQSVEKALVGTIPSDQLSALSNTMLSKIVATMEEQTAHIALSDNDESNQLTKDTNVVRKKQKRERIQQMMMGFVIGAIAIGVLQATYMKVSNNQNPVKDMLAEQAAEAKADHAAKKFNPKREPEVKDTYVDLVLYTDQFYEMYLSQEFHDRFGKAAMEYLLRTWRIEEEKSIQVVSMSQTLVKTLLEKKETVSTDFLEKGLTKLKETETETESKIVEILGSQVKYESYRKFEKKYFRDELEKFYLARNKTGEGHIDQSSESK